MDSAVTNAAKPLVSICIPVHNGERTIRKTLVSIVNQTYSPLDIVVVDNVSTDGTADIIKEFCEKYPIRCVRNETLLWNEDNYNRAASLARGELVCVYHADDIYDSRIVEECVGVYLKSKRTVGAVMTMAKVIDETDKHVGDYHLPQELKNSPKEIYEFDDIFGMVLKYTNSFLVCPTAMFKKELFDSLGGWDYARYDIAADLGFWLKIAKTSGVAVIDKKLISYRVSKAQLSQRVRDRLEQEAFFIVMNDYMDIIRTHKNRSFLIVHQIKDRTIRALNYSAQQDTEQSMRLIRESFVLYFKNIGKILFSAKALGCLTIQAGLWLANILPFQSAGRFYKQMIWNVIFIKKSMISY